VSELHRRLGALLGFIALAAFVSGAGLDAPAVIPAGIVLLMAVFVQPGERWLRYLEPLWQGAALLLSVRAAVRVFGSVGDPVLPMVDLLLLLLCAESLRNRDGNGDARHFALTFALLIAAAAYRPGPLFGLLFAAYVVCGTVVLVVGHLWREARSRELAPPAPRRAFLLRIAGLSTVVIAVSGLVFLFFPRVSQGWAARATPPLARAVVGFSDRVSLGQHGTRIESNPEIVLRIEFPDGPPRNLAALHWRGRAYNRFDGFSWSRADQVGARIHEGRSWAGPVIEQVIYARPLAEVNVLFGLHPIVEITPLSRIRPVRMRNGDYLYTGGEVDPAYRVRSRAVAPSPAALRQVEPQHSPEVLAHLQLPAVTARMMRLADSLRTSAPTLYDHVLAVEHYLKTHFAYTLELPATRREASLDHFLFVRRAGHCEYFSTAMAILLRAGGVATRNVNGFLGGEWNEFGQYLTVTQNNAHSWVEVYFPGHGWVTFDPTPPGAAYTISTGASALSRLRMFADGMNHRWSKWVLDYDVGTQSSVLERLTGAFRGEDAGARAADRGGHTLVWLLAAAVAVLAALLAARRLGSLSGRGSTAATRAYLGVRRAWERAGYPPAEAQPPLAFAAGLARAEGAAGAGAVRVVDLYVQTRFGGVTLSDAQQQELRQAARMARRAAAGAARSRRGRRHSAGTTDATQPVGGPADATRPAAGRPGSAEP
jgi:protein-glutamine gamma-glutamyltransferase